MEERILIDIQHLVKVYKGRSSPAVDQVSLQIREGEIFGILGPNGAGKTTIISILCNIRKATSGRVTIDGLTMPADIRRIKHLTGVVPQDIALYDKLTAYENLCYFGTLYEIPKMILQERIDHSLSRLSLENFKNEKIATFSGGMKRRINLLAGVLHHPRILYLDEPTVGIDVQSRNVILDFLAEMNQQGTTIIYTSHMMEEAQRLCSRVAILDAGKIKAVCTPAELIRSTPGCHNLEDVFLQLTGKNLRDDLI